MKSCRIICVPLEPRGFRGIIIPELEKFKNDPVVQQYKQQDEDVLSYALFPAVATEFFKYREAQQKKVDPAKADTANKAYPV